MSPDDINKVVYLVLSLQLLSTLTSRYSLGLPSPVHVFLIKIECLILLLPSTGTILYIHKRILFLSFNTSECKTD